MSNIVQAYVNYDIEFLTKQDNTTIAIWCKTYEQAKKLLKALDHMEYSWNLGQSLKYETNYNCYKDATCYCLYNNEKKVTFSDYQRFKDKDVKIIRFSKIRGLDKYV